MLQTGVRVGEVAALATQDLDLTNALVTVRRGKGGTGRVVPIGPAATLALSQYLSLRDRRRFADSPRTSGWVIEASGSAMTG